MKLRKIHAVAAATVMAMVLAACGGSDTPTATSTTTTTSSESSEMTSDGPSATGDESAAPAEPSTDESGAPEVDADADLVIWADGTKAPALESAVSQFESDNGITVSVQVVATDLQTNFVTASQAGKAPDIVIGAHDWIGNLVQNGAIDPIQMDAATQALFQPIAIKGVTFDGQIYGVPYAVESVFLVRNTDMAPDAPTSIEDMVTQGKALVAAGTTSEIMAVPVGQNGDAYHMYPFFTSGGGYLFGTDDTGTYDPTDVGLSQPGATAAMTKIAALGAEGALKTSIGGEQLPSFFTDKKTAFMVTGPWNLASIQESGVPFDISPVPGFEGGDPARPFVGVQAAFVASKGAHKAIAEEFVNNYFATDAVAKALYDVDPRPSALITAFDAEVADDPLVAKEIEAASAGDILPAIPEMATIWDPLGKAIAAVVGGADPTSTTAAAASAVEQAIGG